MTEQPAHFPASRILNWTAPILAVAGVVIYLSRPGGQGSVPTHGSASEWIDAPPELLFDRVSDVTNIGQFSPETVEAEWIDGATGPAVGARFRGHVKQNERIEYWTTCRVTTSERGHEFAFVMEMAGREINHWRYQFTPDLERGGTTVTESFEIADWFGTRIFWRLIGRVRRPLNMSGMQTTLANLKQKAEKGEQAG